MEHRQLGLLTGDAPRMIIDSDGALATYISHFVDDRYAEECLQSLVESVPWEQKNLALYGREIQFPRLVAWYDLRGAAYKFSRIQVNSATEMHPIIADLIDRASSAANVRFNSVLLNLYRCGSDSISWHTDAEPELGENPTVASVSFGTTRRFRLRRPDDPKRTISVDLEHNSLLLMSGTLMHQWQHQIPKQPTVAGVRVNLTCRVMI